MTQGETQVVGTRRLRVELRRMREASRQTQKSVAEKVGWSTSKLMRIENGVNRISTADVIALLHVYDVADPALVEDLLAITRQKRRSWWDKYLSTIPTPFFKLISYEGSAVRIDQFANLSVPELLQTEEYARAALNRPSIDKNKLEDRVRILRKRKELLDRDPGPEVTFILYEAVLHRTVGRPDIMRHQLIWIKELAAHRRVSLRIVPFSEGLPHEMNAPFTILELPGDKADFVVFVENRDGYEVIDNDSGESNRYLEVFRELEKAACPEEQVHAIIDSVIDRF